jgi:hypothetical protein
VAAEKEYERLELFVGQNDKKLPIEGARRVIILPDNKV